MIHNMRHNVHKTGPVKIPWEFFSAAWVSHTSKTVEQYQWWVKGKVRLLSALILSICEGNYQRYVHVSEHWMKWKTCYDNGCRNGVIVNYIMQV